MRFLFIFLFCLLFLAIAQFMKAENTVSNPYPKVYDRGTYLVKPSSFNFTGDGVVLSTTSNGVKIGRASCRERV